MRALLVDDEELVLDGMAAYLGQAWPDLSLDRCADPELAAQWAACLPYAVVLLDWGLLAADGRRCDASGLVRCLQQAPAGAPPILLVSGADPEACRCRVIELGLAGYVPKHASGAQLLQAMRVAMAGGRYRADDQAVARASAAAAEPPAHTDAQQLRRQFPELTARQAEVLQVLVCGASDKEIARVLGLSHHTVRSHVRGVLAVLGARRRGEAVHRVAAAPGPDAAALRPPKMAR